MLTIICALTENRAIGRKGALLYHLPADLRHFKELTTGHTIVMGRRTYESLPKGALPNRRNIVITRQVGYTAPGAEVYHSFEAALNACTPTEDVYIIGGESVYTAALPVADRLCLTHIHAAPADADTFFPDYDSTTWKPIRSEEHEADEKNAVAFAFTDYTRR